MMINLKTIMMSVFAVAAIFSSQAEAYSEADLATLRRTGSCKNCDLSKLSFSNEDFSNADLTGANLSQTAWSNCKMKNVNLTDANMTHSAFYRVDFTGATFSNTNTRHSIFFLCSGR